MVVSRKRAAWRRMPDMEGGCWWREASVTPWRPRPTLPTHLASYQCPSMGNAPKSWWVKRPQRWLEQGGGGEGRQGRLSAQPEPWSISQHLGERTPCSQVRGGWARSRVCFPKSEWSSQDPPAKSRAPFPHAEGGIMVIISLRFPWGSEEIRDVRGMQGSAEDPGAQQRRWGQGVLTEDEGRRELAPLIRGHWVPQLGTHLRVLATRDGSWPLSVVGRLE